MKIALRVDASSQIGTGHFMRCLTLADGLKQQCMHIRFVSRHMPEHLRDMLVAKGHEFVLLQSDQIDATLDELAHASWLSASQEQDAMDSIHALSDETWNWLIVDHYALDFRWETKLRKIVNKILVIDDIADRQHDCDILLDQNFCEDRDARYVGLVPAHCQLLLGPRYGILREEFWKLRELVKPRDGSVKRILVFFGGVDADNYTGLAIEALLEIHLHDVRVDVVIGAAHPYREQLIEKCTHNHFICHVQTERMAELMAAADLSIGAVGAATLERCAMGVPSIALVLAENQRKAASDLEAAGVLINLGDAKQVTIKGLAGRIRALIGDEKLRTELSKTSLKLVSCLTQHNVAEIIMGHNA